MTRHQEQARLQLAINSYDPTSQYASTSATMCTKADHPTGRADIPDPSTTPYLSLLRRSNKTETRPQSAFTADIAEKNTTHCRLFQTPCRLAVPRCFRLGAAPVQHAYWRRPVLSLGGSWGRNPLSRDTWAVGGLAWYPG